MSFLTTLFVGFLVFSTAKRVDFTLNNCMYLPVEPGRLVEGPVNRGPENRGCTVLYHF